MKKPAPRVVVFAGPNGAGKTTYAEPIFGGFGNWHATEPTSASSPRCRAARARVIYFWRTAAGQIYLLYAYAKNAQADLTPAQTRLLVQLVKEITDHE